jgi:hypothetical protein
VTGLTAPTLIPNRSRTAVPWFGPDEAGRPSRPDACGDQETDLACAQVQKCDRVATLQWQMSSGSQAWPNVGVRHPVVEVLYEGGAG